MKEITLKNGFTVDAGDLNTDDYELFEDMVECETNQALVPSVMRRLLGEEAYKRFKDANRDEDGKVRVSAMQSSISELFAAIGEAKKK